MLSCDTVYYALQGGSNFESADEIILKCEHLSESSVLSCGTVYYTVHGGSNF